MAPVTDIEQILEILRSGTAEERRRFVESLPETGMKSAALMMMESDQPVSVVLGLVQLAMAYCYGQDASVGAPLAAATHLRAVELFEAGGDHGLLTVTLSNLANLHVGALNLLGRSEEVIAITDEYIPYYERLGENENLPALKTARINALLNLNRVDEADEALRDPNLRGNPATDIEISRLQRDVDQRKERITDIAAPTGAAGTAVPSGTDLIELLKKTIGGAIDDEGQRNELLEVIKNLDPSNRLDPNDPEDHQRLLEILRKGEDFLSGRSPEDNEWTMAGKIREATAIFHPGASPGQRTRENYEKSLCVLKECLEWTREHTHLAHQNDSLWGIYLCHARLDQPSRAADALLLLWRNLEEARKGIRAPLERGGVFSRYPYLFDALCEKLQTAGRTEELLEAIEASKGRGIADILTQKSQEAVPDADIYGAVKALPELTRRERFHYLTYYVDTDFTHAVLVSSRGGVHTLGQVEISKAVIREASQFVDPKHWGTSPDYDYSIVIEDVSVRLAPLVAGLEGLLDQGVIRKGDHISCSADDSFCNVPLQYLRFKGKPLIDTFSVSRIQNAFHLRRVLSLPAEAAPSEFVSYMVPTRQNLQMDNWPDMERNLRQPTQWLQAQIDGQVFENEHASIAQLTRLDLNHKVLQFSTHGIFPRTQEAQNPFYQSGLVLSYGNSLPDADVIGRGDREAVLTPAKVLELGLELRRSHVSLMACVSGLSREGLGGDALGMDWAFIQAGASSLLSSHWYVSAALSAVFFENFYDHWIRQKKSRLKAYQDTIRDLRAQEGRVAGVGSWAAFSLTGDWR